MADEAAPVLDVRGLTTVFLTRQGEIHAVNAVSFALKRGEVLGVVGESGSGKSVTMMSLVGLLPTPPAEVRAGQVMLGTRDLLQMSAKDLSDVRGAKVGFVFQDPMTSLNPAYTVGSQMTEVLRRHRGTPRAQAVDRAAELLALVGITDVIFAVDSIPAIFAITNDPFIVLTSNIFAILGLRAMFFLLAAVAAKFHLLSYGLAVILVFIGTKMLLIDVYKIPVLVSLGVVVAVLAITIGAGLGAAGAAMQGYLRNPLADPGLFGIAPMAAVIPNTLRLRDDVTDADPLTGGGRQGDVLANAPAAEHGFFGVPKVIE
jgi:predicted tellurium resistance membrane protein TerC